MKAARGKLARVGCFAAMVLCLGADSRAQDLFLGDLMDRRITITAGFNGTDVFIYGVKEGDGDVVVVFRGPPVDYSVRRKERIAGIWLNTDRVDFQGVPSFYAIAASKPLDQLMTPAAQAREDIGVAHLNLIPASDASSSDTASFAAALVRVKEAMGLYGSVTANISFENRPLYRGTVHFPANVTTGNYDVRVLLVRGGEVVGAQTIPLQINKGGADAWVYDRAHDQSAAYGLCAIAGALLLGWAAHLVFRKI